LQRTFFTLLPYEAAQSGRTAGSDQPLAKDGGAAWQQLATPAPGLGPSSDGPLSWPPGLGTVKDRGAGGMGCAAGDDGGGTAEQGRRTATRTSGERGDKRRVEIFDFFRVRTDRCLSMSIIVFLYISIDLL